MGELWADYDRLKQDEMFMRISTFYSIMIHISICMFMRIFENEPCLFNFS